MDILVFLLIQESLQLIDSLLKLAEIYYYILGFNAKNSFHLFQGYSQVNLIYLILASLEHQITPHWIQEKQRIYRMKKIKNAYHQ